MDLLLSSHTHTDTEVSMKWTHTFTGIFLCSSASAVMLPLPEHGSGLQITGPKIVAVTHRLDVNDYYITCKVQAESLKAETTVYWLVNGSFVEEAYPDGRVKTFQKRVTSSSRPLKTTLHFTQVLPEDFSTTLTCIALNSAGFDTRRTTLKKKNGLLDHKKRIVV
ncbi:interleukin-1 receptor type 2-like [Pygocentrus nattereri]|uniref:interleukin-1 receptor type 2-like n=1 Tax=Pygocentrus nattereri TaxID=42514 RepID=UPI0008144C0C|nr:interleukin-1 receptor type 2-like [Pygocentrus nattereri]